MRFRRWWHAFANISSAFQHTFQLLQESLVKSFKQPYSRAPVLKAYSSYDPVMPAKTVAVDILPEMPSELSKQMAERRSPRRSQNTETLITSRLHVLSTTRSIIPRCWTYGELLVLRDCSMPAGTRCPAFLGYKKTSPAHSQTSS